MSVRGVLSSCAATLFLEILAHARAARHTIDGDRIRVRIFWMLICS
jgi:hypothetical protein